MHARAQISESVRIAHTLPSYTTVLHLVPNTAKILLLEGSNGDNTATNHIHGNANQTPKPPHDS